MLHMNVLKHTRLYHLSMCSILPQNYAAIKIKLCKKIQSSAVVEFSLQWVTEQNPILFISGKNTPIGYPILNDQS